MKKKNWSDDSPTFRKPEDTSKRDPIIHVLGSLSAGSSGYIESMERAGQAQLVASTSIPTRRIGCTEDQLRALGFELGPLPKEGEDQLFRPARLPQGWSIKPTDHSMHSDLLDDRGYRRGGIFYKAAFYDRSAHLSLSVRLKVREDWEAAKRDGTVAYEVTAQMPGDSEKTIHRSEHPEKFDPSDRRGWAAGRSLEGEVASWLAEHYPQHEDPLAYWDVEF